LSDDTAIQLKSPSTPQVRYGSQWDHAAQIDDALRREPQRQLSTGGMSGRDGACEVKVVAGLERDQVLGSVDDIVGHAGPISARIAEAPVFETPHSGARAGQRGAQVTGVIQVEGASPKSAVNEEDGWVGDGTFWKEQVAELRWFFTVRYARVGFGWGECQNVLRDGRGGGG
jgi:hypothetical protein